MSISLYTSRLFLQILGVEDFGIYNLVGGVVVLFSFLNNAMNGATQRYLNIEMATDQIQRFRKVFSMGVNVHAVVAVCVLILFETIGLWILNFQLNIPAERMVAANVVYQCSLFTAIIEVLKAPWNATILVHERMSFYAVMSVLETVLRAGIIISLTFLSPAADKLMWYSLLLVGLALLSSVILWCFCRRLFGAKVRYTYQPDRQLFHQFLSFSGWSMMGQVATLTTLQTFNFLLNNFFGVLINAALGIAGQLSGAIYNFVSNVQVALNPQIVQRLARGEHAGHVRLVLQGSRFSFFILAVISVPFLLGTGYILDWWLGSVPPYAEGVTKLVICSSLVSALAGPLWMSVYALGRIKRYQIIISILFLAQIPVFYVLLHQGFSPYSIMVSKIVMELGILVFRLYFFKTSLEVELTQIGDYIKRIAPLFVGLIGVVWWSTQVDHHVMELLGWTCLTEALVLLFIMGPGTKREERQLAIAVVKRRIFRR